MNHGTAITAWQALLGSERVILGDAVARLYGEDCSGTRRQLPAALKARRAEDVVEIVRIAHRHGTPLYPISTGRNWGYGSALPARDGCVILDLGELNRIVDFDAALGVVTVEPGVTQGMLAQFLEGGSHPYMVPTTGAGPSCSLVGNALERGYGITPHSDHFAAVTDVEAVLADGTVFRTALREAGGEDIARLFKWGLGPYVPGLFTQGNFGVVTRMSIVLARRPEVIKVCLFGLREDRLLEPAVERVQSLLGRLPGIVGGLNLMNRHRVLAMSAPYPAGEVPAGGLIPPEVVDAMGRQYQAMPWTGFGTLYGTARTVRAAQSEIRRALRGVANRLVFISPQMADTLARISQLIPGGLGRTAASTASTLAQSLQLVAGRPNETALPLAYWRNRAPPPPSDRHPTRDQCGLLWYAPLVPMRPDQVRNYVRTVTATLAAHLMEPLITLTSLSDRVFDSTVPLLFDRRNPGAEQAARRCHQALVEAGRRVGCFPYRLDIDSMDQFEGTSAAQVLARLRQAIDTGDVLAPGRYGGPSAGGTEP